MSGKKKEKHENDHTEEWKSVLKKKERRDYRCISLSPRVFRRFSNENACWYESQEAVKEGMARAVQRKKLLIWIRRQMKRKLTAREQQCLQMYFFKNMTFDEIGKKTGTSLSSSCQAVRRAIRKLRHAASRGKIIDLSKGNF